MGCNSSQEEKWEGYAKFLEQDTTRQTIMVPNSQEKGATPIYRNPRAQNGFLGYLKSSKNDDEKHETEINTGWLVFKDSAQKFKNNACFGYRTFVEPLKDSSNLGTYKWETYGEVYNEILEVGYGIGSLELTDGSAIGMYSINRHEWMVCHLANWSQSHPTTALYDSLGAHAVEYIIWHSEVEAIFYSKSQTKALLEGISLVKESEKSNELKLKYIIQFDYQKKYNNQHESVDQKDVETASKMDIKLIGLSELKKIGSDFKQINEPKPEDLAYNMYSSGTTGDPKGVMLKHKNFAYCVASAVRGLAAQGFNVGSTDSHVSFLPLAHSFEASIQMSLLKLGAKIAFFNGNIKKISEDWKEIKPTTMIGVPRIYSKTFDKINAIIKQKGGLAKKLFDNGFPKSASLARKGQRDKFYDKLLWSKLSAQLGYSELRFIASGAAPMPPHVAEFLKIVCPGGIFSQGYGLTETLAISFFTDGKDHTLGHVGVPVDNVEYRLIDAPENGYYTTDKPYPRGEVQIRGLTVMTGYFKNKEKTDECLDKNGWFSTGDIGRVNGNGTLSIIDRRKNMFKTCNGEYIAAEKIEIQYASAHGIGQIWVYGNSFKSFIVSIVVPDPLYLVPVLREKNLWKDESPPLTPATEPFNQKFEKICLANKKMIKELLVNNLRKVETGLEKHEKIKDISLEFKLDLLLQGFNVDNGCLTPTFKLKRPNLYKKYKNEIMELYTANGESPKDTENW